MSTSPAFLQLLAFVEKEQTVLEKYAEIYKTNSLVSQLALNYETLVGNHKSVLSNSIDTVLGNSKYITSFLIEKAEQVGKMCGIQLATIDEYNLHDTALSLNETMPEKVKALIALLNPEADYYQRMLATHLVRNYVPNFDDYGSVPVKKYIPVEQLELVANSIDPEALVISSVVMDADTQKYRELHENLFVVYLNELKELVYTLLAMTGVYLNHFEIEKFNNNFTQLSNCIAMTKDFEFHGISFRALKDTKQIELFLTPEMTEIVKEIAPFIYNYHHQYY